MATVLHGRFFEAGVSRVAGAQLHYAQGAFRVLVEGREMIWNRAETEISSHVAGLPCRFVFPDSSCFEAEPGTELDAFFIASLNLNTGVRWGFRRHPLLMTAAVVATALMPVLLWLVFPAVSDAIARTLPPTLERSIGDKAFALYDQREFDPSEVPVRQQQKVRQLFAQMVAATGEPPKRYRLHLRRSEGLGANALVFPGGVIVVTDALIELSRHDDELAGVLAHELVHVSERHGIRSLARFLGLALLVQLLLFGDSSALLDVATAVGVGLTQLSYSRAFEREADARAAELMRTLDRDPSRMIDLLRRIQPVCGEGCEGPSLLSSHPGLEERLRTMSR